jgi:hypothetical protein
MLLSQREEYSRWEAAYLKQEDVIRQHADEWARVPKLLDELLSIFTTNAEINKRNAEIIWQHLQMNITDFVIPSCSGEIVSLASSRSVPPIHLSRRNFRSSTQVIASYCSTCHDRRSIQCSRVCPISDTRTLGMLLRQNGSGDLQLKESIRSLPMQKLKRNFFAGIKSKRRVISNPRCDSAVLL